MTRAGAAVVLAVVMAAVGGGGRAPAGAQAAPVNHDFATEVLGDPWDFSNAEDALLAHGPPVSLNVTNARLGDDGTYQWTADTGFVDLHPMTVPGALPDSRDGRWNPVDADRYTHVSMRLYASQGQAFRVGWFTCAYDYTPCFSYHDFRVQQGWQTITLPMRQISTDWRGELLGIRLASGAGSTDFKLDWFRIHTADSSPTPPAGAPQPQVLTPDPAGGEDAAEVVVGNAWDFLDAADVVGAHNVRDAHFEDGRFEATNAPPQQDNPWIQLPHGPGIDPSRYHLLTISTTYDGPFSLGFGPGGGMHGRWLFRRADTGLVWADSRELVTYPSRPTVTYDLTDGRFGSTVEPGFPSWTGSTITGLRWDPNEDPGARTWRVDDIRLAAPHEASGLFDVQWRDRAHQPGTTVDVGVSRRRGDTSTSPVATDIAQRAGINTARLDLSHLAPGEWWVWVRATSPDGVTSTSTAQGVLVATGRIAGPDRVATSTAFSELGWEDGADTAVVASARGFPDALAGVQLADAVDGPMLLTEPDRLVPALADELRRLAPSEVLVLGGPNAVSPDVVDAIGARLPDATVRRISGPDRYATAAAIATTAIQRWEQSGATIADEVLLASGLAFPDALAAGPYVAASHAPMLLTAPDHLPDATRDALADRGGADGGRGGRVRRRVGRRARRHGTPHPPDRRSGPL